MADEQSGDDREYEVRGRILKLAEIFEMYEGLPARAERTLAQMGIGPIQAPKQNSTRLSSLNYDEFGCPELPDDLANIPLAEITAALGQFTTWTSYLSGKVATEKGRLNLLRGKLDLVESAILSIEREYHGRSQADAERVMRTYVQHVDLNIDVLTQQILVSELDERASALARAAKAISRELSRKAAELNNLGLGGGGDGLPSERRTQRGQPRGTRRDGLVYPTGDDDD